MCALCCYGNVPKIQSMHRQCSHSDNLKTMVPHVPNLVPRLCGRGKKVWYPLLAHAQPYFCVVIIVWFMGMRLQCQESGRQLVNSPDHLQIICSAEKL